MNTEIKKEKTEPDVRYNEPINNYNWPPISGRTRSKTSEFYNQNQSSNSNSNGSNSNASDIFGFGKALEKKSFFSLEHMK